MLFFICFLIGSSLAESAIILNDLSYVDKGRAEIQSGKLTAARSTLDQCIRLSNEQEQINECQWELGWVHWKNGHWNEVVSTWENLYARQPKREGLERYLNQARDNLSLDSLLLSSRNGAQPTFVSKAPEGATISIAAVGDMMIGTDFPKGKLPPNDGDGMFDGVVKALSADLTFGNLEGPLCDKGKTTKCKPGAAPGSCYAFRTPSHYVKHYASAGFDLLSTANNHASDFGQVCRLETERILDEANIAHSGRPGDIATVTHNGIVVSMIAFSTSRSSHYINDHKQAAELVSSLASKSDIVIVSFHGGAEGKKALHVPNGREKFYGEDRGHLREFTHEMIDAGADLILGHGPHVLRAIEIYKNRLIAYSLGNFATYGRFNLSGPNGLGVVLKATLANDGSFLFGKLESTKQIKRGIPVMDDEFKGADLVRMLSEEDFPQTGVLVAKDGTISKR